MNKDTSKVTIIMATYNRAHFIVETLQSIQEQTFTDWECLIIDDGGTDNTLAVTTPILEKDKRFKYLKRPVNFKKGIPGCRNYGINIAKGDYIIFFDDDDIVHPQNLELCIEAFHINTIDFCVYEKKAFFNSSNTINFQEEKITIDKPISMSDIEAIIMNTISISSCTVMWKKECFFKEKFNENLLYAEEWECYPRVISNNKYGIKLRNVLYFNRKHPISNTGEFHNNHPIRRASKKEAILLVVQNLKEKQLLSHSLLRYFVQQSLSFKEYDLFNQILKSLKLPALENIKWQLFYYVLPLRLWLFGKWKRIKKYKK
jgi:glycosyltransferase involved in cell wall biosynthesis